MWFLLNYFQQPWFDEVMRRGKYISDVYMGFRQVPPFLIAVKGESASSNILVL
jgi:two-component system, NtrC family, sensor kinase